jgi:chaperonin cofactor prefoldin
LELHQWRETYKEKIEQLGEQSRKLQRNLKAICATVRNEYSTACLQEVFEQA